MTKNNYHVIGVMSGTSLDGIDLAELHFYKSKAGSWDYKIIIAVTVPYPLLWKELLKEDIFYSEKKIVTFNEQYTLYLAKVISGFIYYDKIKDLDAICSHGHTIKHQPDKGFTLQIGNLPSLAKKINQKVVCDFRIKDVELGGNGAPLVPIGDRLLFSEYDYCLNLGGFANISFEKQDLKRIAYDICPVNIVLNHYAELLGKPYDKNGFFAASGKLNTDLLQKLNRLEYYSNIGPKSLGLEWVQHEIFPLLESSGSSLKDILHTFIEHIAIQLASQLSEGNSVLITGGGVYNKYLIRRLKKLTKIEIIIPSPKLIEYKEALIFGLLGVLKLRNENNCLSSVTGAKKDHSSGEIFIP